MKSFKELATEAKKKEMIRVKLKKGKKIGHVITSPGKDGKPGKVLKRKGMPGKKDILQDDVMFGEGYKSVEDVKKAFKKEWAAVKSGRTDIGSSKVEKFYSALFDFFADSGDMPLGTQKARTGDPHEWIHDRLGLDEARSSPGYRMAQSKDPYTVKYSAQKRGGAIKITVVDGKKAALKFVKDIKKQGMNGIIVKGNASSSSSSSDKQDKERKRSLGRHGHVTSEYDSRAAGYDHSSEIMDEASRSSSSSSKKKKTTTTVKKQKGSTSAIKYGQSYKDLQKSFKYDTLTGKRLHGEEVEEITNEAKKKGYPETPRQKKDREAWEKTSAGVHSLRKRKTSGGKSYPETPRQKKEREAWKKSHPANESRVATTGKRPMSAARKERHEKHQNFLKLTGAKKSKSPRKAARGKTEISKTASRYEDIEREIDEMMMMDETHAPGHTTTKKNPDFDERQGMFNSNYKRIHKKSPSKAEMRAAGVGKGGDNPKGMKAWKAAMAALKKKKPSLTTSSKTKEKKLSYKERMKILKDLDMQIGGKGKKK